MHDAQFWIAFFGAPLFIVLVTAFVLTAGGSPRSSSRMKFGT